MNEMTLRALIDNGAVKKVRVVASGAKFHVEFKTVKECIVAQTNKGAIKNWSSLDSAARWLKKLGVGSMEVTLDYWQPSQKSLML